MATRLKTIEYYFPMIDTIADNVSTPASGITVYIPEASALTVTFKKVTCDVVVADKYTTAGNVSNKNIVLTLSGASSSAVNNANTLTQSGENFAYTFSGDFTSYFQSNWGTNASRFLNCSILINATALGSANASIRILITYEFDDEATTQIKTVWIPLNAPTGALPITKSTIYDTIPALDTYCPEASKSFKQITIVVQGNTESNTATDISISFEAGTSGAYTSVVFEKGTTVDLWYRVHQVASFATNSTHDFYLWASATDFDHPQTYLVVTYEFDPLTTTTILNSLLLPMEFGGTMGGPTSSDYQRAERELWIQENNISTQRIACLVFYDKLAPQAGMFGRIGTGSFISYTCVASVLGGGAGFMLRNDAAFTLDRGRNSLNCDLYNTDTADLGFNVASLWIINYTSDVPSEGIWAANHTILWNLAVVGTSAAAVQRIVASTAPILPENSFFYTSIGLHYIYVTNSTGNAAGVHIGAERTVPEGGLVWENVYEALGGTDPEVGIRQAFATARSVFKRWNSNGIYDPDATRLILQNNRRWRVCLGGSAASFDYLNLMVTYHTIQYPVNIIISGSTGGTVNLKLVRESNNEPILTTGVTGNGLHILNWFDDTEEIYITAYESPTLNKITTSQLVDETFTINLAPTTSGGGEFFF